MKLVWSAEELVEHWSVEPKDWANIPDTAEEAGCLGFVAQLTFYRMWARFPDGRADFAPTVFAYLTEQLGISDATIEGYDWHGRTGRRHRRLILRAAWGSPV
jgi:hypothetical protein